MYIGRMSDDSYSLNDLAEATGIEARTIRSYIERGLVPGAQTRGRAATYSEDHLSRLQVIMSLRRARPNISLSEIRVVLQGLNIRKKHVKRQEKNARGTIVDKEMPLHISNVSICDENGKAVKVKVRANKEGQKELFYRLGDKDVVHRLVQKHTN